MPSKKMAKRVMIPGRSRAFDNPEVISPVT
jgi:hypothetical protein